MANDKPDDVALMTSTSFEPLVLAVPLREEPAGVFRVGDTRVLLELVLDAYKRGESPESIVRSYRSLRLADVYAVITRYLADPAPFDEYLRHHEEDAEVVRKKLEDAGMAGRVTKEVLLERAREKGLKS